MFSGPTRENLSQKNGVNWCDLGQVSRAVDRRKFDGEPKAMSDEIDALDYLRGVYRGKIVAESQRMRAAIAALPFERPKLAVTANVHSFAAQMEEIGRRSGKSNVIDAQARYNTSEPLKIEAKSAPIQTDPGAGGFRRRL
jgi:hypothetical protein